MEVNLGTFPDRSGMNETFQMQFPCQYSAVQCNAVPGYSTVTSFLCPSVFARRILTYSAGCTHLCFHLPLSLSSSPSPQRQARCGDWLWRVRVAPSPVPAGAGFWAFVSLVCPLTLLTGRWLDYCVHYCTARFKVSFLRMESFLSSYSTPTLHRVHFQHIR